MTTKAQAVLELAESQVGIRENPMGSNYGGCEKYQDVYTSPPYSTSGWPEGEPWCGCFVGWVYDQIVPGGRDYASPSTQVMCDSRPNVSAQPGAAFVQCGIHTGLLRYRISGNVWATVEGNHGDQVAFGQRDITGWQVVGPPWLGEGSAPAPPATSTWYFLQDTGAVKLAGQHGFYGGWSDKAARDKAYKTLKADLGHEIRKFRDTAWPSSYFLDNSAFVDEIYGGWSSKASRDSAQSTLEARLGRALRPFAEERTAAQGGVPWATKNT
jgi:hypothetical protein